MLSSGKIIALSDVNRASAEAIRFAMASDAVIHAIGEELNASKDFDVVLVMSRVTTHEGDVLAAKAQDKPYFCEKPLTTRAEGAKLQRAILTDLKDRFVSAYDVELADFLKVAANGATASPSSWDGYIATTSSYACVVAQESASPAITITMADRPTLYN